MSTLKNSEQIPSTLQSSNGNVDNGAKQGVHHAEMYQDGIHQNQETMQNVTTQSNRAPVHNHSSEQQLHHHSPHQSSIRSPIQSPLQSPQQSPKQSPSQSLNQPSKHSLLKVSAAEVDTSQHLQSLNNPRQRNESITSPQSSHTPFLKFKYFTFSLEQSIAQIISASKSLYYLDLTGNQINDSILEKICTDVFLHKRSPMLRHLNLTSNAIGASGVEALCKVLDKQAEYLPCLEYLDLSCNSIGDDGAERLISCLSQKQTRLKSLSVRSNNIKNTNILMQLALLPKTTLNHELKTVFI